MKRIINIIICILFVLLALLPVGTVLSSYFGYTFTLNSELFFAIAIAALSVGIVVLDTIHEGMIQNRAICVLLAINTPLSLVSAVFYMFSCSQIWVFASTVTCIVCCFILTVKYAKSLVIKMIVLVLSGLLILPVSFFGFMMLFFGNFGQNTVVQTVESPNGKYYAQVIDSNQGALGGDTHVNVYEKSGINLLLFKIEKKPQQVYFGEWGEYENMEIYWKDDNCIVINSVPCKIE